MECCWGWRRPPWPKPCVRVAARRCSWTGMRFAAPPALALTIPALNAVGLPPPRWDIEHWPTNSRSPCWASSADCLEARRCRRSRPSIARAGSTSTWASCVASSTRSSRPAACPTPCSSRSEGWESTATSATCSPSWAVASSASTTPSFWARSQWEPRACIWSRQTSRSGSATPTSPKRTSGGG